MDKGRAKSERGYPGLTWGMSVTHMFKSKYSVPSTVLLYVRVICLLTGIFFS